MATVHMVRLKNGTPTALSIEAAYHERSALRSLGARWSKTSGQWRLPLDADLYRLAKTLDLEWSEDARAWLDHQRDTVRSLLQLHRAPDADISVQVPGLDAYQRVGIKYLATAQKAILADDVGLGKTLQSLLATREVGSGRTLIVTRKSLIFNWQREIQHWLSADVGQILSTDSAVPATPFVLTNYEAAIKHLDSLMKTKWDALIVDEAPYVKNRKAKRTKTIAKLARKIPYVWLLSATPMPNGVWELWSLLNIMQPDIYKSYWRFVDRFCYTRPNSFGGQDILPGIKNKAAFQREVAPFMLRRTKSLLNLPPLSQETIYVPFHKEQKRVYEQLKTRFLAELADGTLLMTPTALAQLTRLRQVACCPSLVGSRPDSGKTAAFLELLEDRAPLHKVLVFTTFAQYVKELMPALERYQARSIIGEKSQAERQEAEQAFQNDPSCRVLIGTIGAMGEGLNLQAADLVVFLNKDWTPSNNEVQAVGRAHRRGQKKPVHVISLISGDSVEEAVEGLLQRKLTTQRVFEEIVRRLASSQSSAQT